MASQTAPVARRRRSALIKVALVAGGCLCAFAAAECAVRVRDRLQGKPYSSWSTQLDMEQIVNWMNASMQTQGQQPRDAATDGTPAGPELHPYVGFDWPNSAADVATEIEYFAGPQSRVNYDILIVGGSVAAGFGETAGKKLGELLREDPLFRDQPVHVLSNGRGGYKEPQQLLLVAYFLSVGYTPDAIINLDGFNDVALANANVEAGANPAHPSLAHWGHLANDPHVDRTALDLLLDMRTRQLAATELLASTLKWHLPSSAFLGSFAAHRLRSLQRQYTDCYLRYVKYLEQGRNVTTFGPPVPEGKDAARELAIKVWYESSLSLSELCQARGIDYIHVLQPTLHDTDSKPLTESEVATGTAIQSWIDGVHFGYPKLRALGPKLREAGVDFIDGSQAFANVRDPLYHDACHFNEQGNFILARVVADALLAHRRSK